MLLRKQAGSHKAINTWIIYVALPAVSFKYLPHIQWNADMLIPLLAPLTVWLGAWIYITYYYRRANLGSQQIGSLKLTAGLSNTSFVGFPLITAWFTPKDITIGIICDQVTFILLSTAGIVVAINSAGTKKLSVSAVANRLLAFPPFIGCVLALTLPSFIDLSPLEPLFDKLASTVGPLALFSIGMQLKLDGWKEYMSEIMVALFYKLLLAPLIVLLVLIALNITGNIARITVFEMAMPTLLSAGIVSEEYGLDAKLSSLITGIGIILALVTSALWYYVVMWLL